MVSKKKQLEILIVAKQNKAGIKMAKKLEKELLKYTDKIYFDRSTGLRLGKHGTSIKSFDGNFIITVGGDGTFLWTAHQSHVPILPVRIEGHGFLCTCDFKDLLDNISRLIKGDYTIQERLRLQCSREKQSIFDKFLNRTYPYSINEIVFGRKRPSKILELEYKIDDTVFYMKGDGIMFVTPSGSTAYNSSAGGSIIDPSLEVIAIVPLYPFFSKLKPKIIPATKKVEVIIKNGDCALIVDGHTGEYVKGGTRFTIERGEPVKVIYLTPSNFYGRLKEQFID